MKSPQNKRATRVWGLVVGPALVYASDDDVVTAIEAAVAMLEVA